MLFMDAVDTTQSTKLSYGWIRRGQDKLIEKQVTGNRTRLNITGALSPENIGAPMTENYDNLLEKQRKRAIAITEIRKSIVRFF